MSYQLTGVVVPMITPLTEDERLDRASVQRMVNFLIHGGVHGLFVLGSIGEGALLDPSIRHELVEVTVEATAGRVPVIAGVLEPSTNRVVNEVRALAGRGLSGYVATTPYYFSGYSNGDLYRHFSLIAEAADRPILLYNIPQNTKVTLDADLVLRLAETPNIVGIKDSSGDWAQVQTILLNRSPGFAVLQGNQSLSAISLLFGAEGLVPGHANVWPGLLVGLVAAARRGDTAAAMSDQARLDTLIRLRGRATVHTFKVIAKALGLIACDHVASPQPQMNDEEVQTLIRGCAAAGLPLPGGESSFSPHV